MKLQLSSDKIKNLSLYIIKMAIWQANMKLYALKLKKIGGYSFTIGDGGRGSKMFGQNERANSRNFLS